MASTRRVLLPLTMLGVGLAGLSLLVRDLLTDFPHEEASAADSARALAADSGSVVPVSRIDSREPEPPPAPERELLPIGSLVLPDRDALHLLELQGRAVFYGLVLMPDGAPCPGATIFHRGEPVTTSDANGAWKIEVEHDAADRFDGSGGVMRRELVAARKEGVGTASALLAGPSRRIDLLLGGGHRLFGSCLDRWTKEPVVGANLDLILEPVVDQHPAIGMTLTTVSDELGRFAFEQLPSATFELRGRGKGHDSNGYEPLDFTGARDRDYLLLLDPTITARGWFSPWPPPGGPFAAAQVVVRTASPQDHGFDHREFRGVVGDDGRFAVELPQCPRFEASLLAGAGLLWRTRFDLDVAPHDVDFGRIELAETGRIRGRVAIPRMFAEAGTDLHLLVDQPSSRDELVATLPADGSFAFGPARPGPAGFFLLLPSGDQVSLVSKAMRDAFAAAVEEPPKLEPPAVVANEERVVDDLVLDSGDDWICVRVQDEAGVPIVQASVRVDWPDRRDRYQMPARGRGGFYAAQLYGRWDDDGGRSPRTCEVEVRAIGFAARRFEHALPATPGFSSLECRLDYGERTHGVVVDGRGTPLVGWRVSFEERADDRHRRTSRGEPIPPSWDGDITTVLSDAQGEFDCYGFDATHRHVTLLGPAGDSMQIDDPVVTDGTLRLTFEPESTLARRGKGTASGR